MPVLERPAGFPLQSPTLLLGLTSFILMAQPRCSPLTLGVVGLSECLHGDRSVCKHGVKERRCLMELTDSSAEKEFKMVKKQLVGHEKAWEIA